MQAVWNDSTALSALVERVLALAKKQGAESSEVEASVNQGFCVTARMGELESVEHNRDKSLNITVYFDQRMGAASLSDFSPEAISAAVKAACSIARFTDRDDCAGLARPDELVGQWQDPDLYHPWNITVNDAVDLALHCEKMAFSEDDRIENSEGTAVSTADCWQAYGNSHGFIGSYPASRHEMSCCLVGRMNDEMQRGHSYTLSTRAELLDDARKIAKEAVFRTVSRLGARKLSTRRVPVVFLAEEARGFLGHFVAAASGGNLYRKSSFLLGLLGEEIFPKFIHIDERPHLPGLLGSSPFDDDGVATRPNVFIEAGRLKNYILGVYSAKKLGMQTTGNAGGVHNLFISTGKRDLPALLKKMDTGFLVTEIMGQGVNLVTGDYSRGAAGFWVEKGEIQFPVEEVTVAGNLRDMYAKIVEVGSDVDMRGNIKTGSILIEEMVVAGS